MDLEGRENSIDCLIGGRLVRKDEDLRFGRLEVGLQHERRRVAPGGDDRDVVVAELIVPSRPGDVGTLGELVGRES
jgi:hypothetical protein